MEEIKGGIQTKNLVVGYGKKPLISDVQLQVEPGKVVTLIGPNGSGKSTILKSITQQLEALGGTICIHGQDMKQMKEAEVAKKLSMVMTERLRPELMSCREVVATGRYPYTGKLGILSREDWEIVDQAMKLVKADETAEKDFLQISDGQKQRVMLARAICQETDILVLDEPTSYLDMRYKLEILNSIRELVREKNIAVIMSLHELDLAMKVSDVIVCVEGDAIGKIGSPEYVFKDSYIQRLYGVEAESFNPQTGELFFRGKKGIPEVFVIGGGGSALLTYQSLVKKGISFVAGILSENDLEYSAARAMATEVISVKAFYPITTEDIRKAKQWIDACEKCICSLKEFGPLNEGNKELFEYALNKGYVMKEADVWQK